MVAGRTDKKGWMTMGELYAIIERHIASLHPYEPSVRKVAEQLGVSPTTVGNWRTPTKLIDKDHLQAIARVTKTPYREVLAALLADIGYEDSPPVETDESDTA